MSGGWVRQIVGVGGLIGRAWVTGGGCVSNYDRKSALKCLL